jgi:hypothetical protein
MKAAAFGFQKSDDRNPRSWSAYLQQIWSFAYHLPYSRFGREQNTIDPDRNE